MRKRQPGFAGPGSRPGRWRRRAVLAVTGMLVAGGLTAGVAAAAIDAGAAPKPTISQVRAKVTKLTTQYNKVSEQLDQADEQLRSARQQLQQVSAKLKRARTQFQASQRMVAQIATSEYENSGASSIAGVLTSSNPGAILKQGSLLLEMSTSHEEQVQALQQSASALLGAEQQRQRTESGIAKLQGKLSSEKKHLGSLIKSQKATLASLTAAQQRQVVSTNIGGGGSSYYTTRATDPLPTSGSTANKAVAFAFAQLGCPYVWGATGPCRSGFDCSGLMMASWASAGVTIPRDTYEQWAALPHISLSALRPGDLIYYNGESHVAMYVGNGMIIDAPLPGRDVEELSINTPWYKSNEDGAVRP